MGRIVFGISANFLGESELPANMAYVEHVVYSVQDVSECNVETEQRGCVGNYHGPEPHDDVFLATIASIATGTSAAYVNVHAAPMDEFLECPACRMVVANTQEHGQCCPFCSAVIHDETNDPEMAEFGFDVVVRKLKSAHAVLASHGKSLFVENSHEPPELMRRVLDALPPDVGFTLDVGHAAIVAGDPSEYINLLGHRLQHLHLHDNFGGGTLENDAHLTPGKGSIAWDSLAQALASAQFAGTATFECILPAPAWIARFAGWAEGGID